MDIKEIKKEELQEIIDFYQHIEDFGHIFYDNPQILDAPFSKIMEGINEIRKIIDDNYHI